MAVDSSIGPANLADVGTLAYNGITFSSLYKSSINGKCVQDEGKRTIKLLQYTLEVEGVVTLEAGQATTDQTWTALRKQLSQQAGQLTYSAKGFGSFTINPQGAQAGGGLALQDVAWGPTPEVIEFRPLGGSRSAFIKWTCEIHLPEVTSMQRIIKTPGAQGGAGNGPVLQFNWGHELTYDDEGYSTYSIRGTLEIPLTRTIQQNRAVTATVDDFRKRWLDIQTDLTKFYVVRRHFDYTRDKRQVEWEFTCAELPSMGMPPGCTKATGTMSVRNTGGLTSGKSKLALNMWTCSLRATYTVRRDQDQRVAYFAFLSLLWYRMNASRNAKITPLAQPAPPQQPNAGAASTVLSSLGSLAAGAVLPGASTVITYANIFRSQKKPPPKTTRAIFLTDFGFDEGLYLDSKTHTFHASWWLVSDFTTILEATGAWNWMPLTIGGNTWATSMQGFMGWRGVQANRLDPKTDFIVDFGGTDGAPSDDPFLVNQ